MAPPNLLLGDASPYRQGRGHGARGGLLGGAIEAYGRGREGGIAVETAAAGLGQRVNYLVLLRKRFLRDTRRGRVVCCGTVLM